MGSKILSRSTIESRIANGEMLILYKGHVLKLNGWKAKHPGGDKVLEHFVGWDATDEINIYHSRETLELIPKYSVGTVDGADLPWVNFIPPIRGGKFKSQNADGSVSEFVGGTKGPGVAQHQQDFIDECVRQYHARDAKEYPQVDRETQRHIVENYHQLQDQLMAEGLFDCNYWFYFREGLKFASLLAITAFCLYKFKEASQGTGSGGKWWLFLSAAVLGICWHQMTFVVHDLGHHAVTHNFWIDNLVSIVIADFIGGLSVGWWKRNHNVHHLVTNDPVHDPDIQHLPFFAVSPELFGNVFSSYYEKVLWFDWFAQKLMPLQSYSYYFILCFGRFNLYRLSWEHLLKGLGPRRGKAAILRYIELVGLAFFNYWFTYRLVCCFLTTAAERWLFVMVSHVITMPLHVTITMSHFGMSTADFGPNESFPQRQTRTTMDIVCPPWLDWLHGGLQFQVVHHFYPRLPRTSFRRATEYLKRFCDQVGLKYTAYEFVEGSEGLLSHMEEIGRQARIFNACAKFNQEECADEFANAILAAKKDLSQKAILEEKNKQERGFANEKN